MASDTLISIVDDDRSVRESTMDLLTAAGFVAAAYQQAQDFLKSDRLDSTSCLIADVAMPGMSGLELQSHLVRAGKAIPTILITAFPNDRDRARGLRAGAVCYLAKPFDEDELLACIRSALGQRDIGRRE